MLPSELNRRERAAARHEQAAAFLRELPKVHERGQRPPRSGGLNPRIGQVIIDEIAKLDDGPRSIETGAGNSSLLFMMLGCSSVTAIAPDEKLGHRIVSEADAHGSIAACSGTSRIGPRSRCLAWRSMRRHRARSR